MVLLFYLESFREQPNASGLSMYLAGCVSIWLCSGFVFVFFFFLRQNTDKKTAGGRKSLWGSQVTVQHKGVRKGASVRIVQAGKEVETMEE